MTSVPTVTATEVARLLARTGRPCWLVYAPDRAELRDGHIPGSLGGVASATLRDLADGTPIVVYGEDEHAVAARRLVAHLVAAGADAAWFAGGLRAWAAAGGPVERFRGSGR